MGFRTLLACLIVTFCVTSCSAALTDEEYVARAQDYLDNNKPDAASIELKNALLKNPNNATARWLLGKLQLEFGNLAQAEKELVKARELGVAEGAILPLLAQTLLEQNKLDEVLEIKMNNLAPPQQAEVHR